MQLRDRASRLLQCVRRGRGRVCDEMDERDRRERGVGARRIDEKRGGENLQIFLGDGILSDPSNHLAGSNLKMVI